jgi:hypothetical protein
MAEDKDTKELLEKLLAELYAKTARDQVAVPSGESYLIAEDHQYLGKITDNPFDQRSITNEYGPFGSAFSPTSIFNQFSPYGSEFGQYSVNNSFCTQPPKLYLNARFAGVVSANEFVLNRIPTDAFLHALKHDISSLLTGRVPTNEIELRRVSGEAFIEAADGTFLGTLNPNKLDRRSIFNTYGPHGSKYAQTSIFNKYSAYGGSFSNLSPYNSHTRHPPKIFHGGRQIGFLTVNPTIKPRIDPHDIFEWARRNVRKTY